MLRTTGKTITRDGYRIEFDDRSRDTCRIRIYDAGTGDLAAERDHVDDLDADLLAGHLVTELKTRPRYVVGPGTSWWYPASVFDTQHVRGASATRKKIPCASIATAIDVATELNSTGTSDLN